MPARWSSSPAGSPAAASLSSPCAAGASGAGGSLSSSAAAGTSRAGGSPSSSAARLVRALAPRRFSGPEAATDEPDQLVGVYGLGDVVRRAGGDALLTVTLHRLGRHRDDR